MSFAFWQTLCHCYADYSNQEDQNPCPLGSCSTIGRNLCGARRRRHLRGPRDRFSLWVKLVCDNFCRRWHYFCDGGDDNRCDGAAGRVGRRDYCSYLRDYGGGQYDRRRTYRHCRSRCGCLCCGRSNCCGCGRWRGRGSRLSRYMNEIGIRRKIAFSIISRRVATNRIHLDTNRRYTGELFICQQCQLGSNIIIAITSRQIVAGSVRIASINIRAKWGYISHKLDAKHQHSNYRLRADMDRLAVVQVRV